MTQTETPEQRRVACTFLRETLAGQLRPELVPQMGPWQEVGKILFEALANDGVQIIRRIYLTLCKHDPRCHPEFCVKNSSKQGDKEARADQRT
jgi:hypothetical protein